MRQWPLRVILACAVAGLFVIGLEPGWALATFRPDDYTGRAGRDGVCPQTQYYTCGAAAAATLLGQYGVRTDECEMARLCGSAPLTGTDEVSVCCALQEELRDAGYRVTIERPGQDAVGRYLRPVMTRMKMDRLRDHWVVLFAINDSFAVVGDPVQGRMQVPASDFFADWRGTVIAAGRPPFIPYAMR
jgi:predicted double-glycine peptidase